MEGILPQRTALQRIEAGLYCLGLAGFAYWCTVCAVDLAVPEPSLKLFVLGVFEIAPLCGALLISYALAPRRWKTAAAIAAAAFACVATFGNWHPRQVFVNKLESIKSGMTSKDVNRIMRGYLGGAASPTPYSTSLTQRRNSVATEEMDYRWNDADGRYDGDLARVYLRDGVVVETGFSPD